ncbi:hypothetical protein LG324_12835 [Phycicoccus jejuensis]|uniref:hypothetical protein n=1 Tax=Phycicoccus jejuensis TaxID=367299 RepID=UPI00384D1099
MTFVELDERVTAPRSSLTIGACRLAIEQLRREHASVNRVRRQLGTGWRTVWESIRPILTAAAADESRFEGVRILGVDEHVWHHVSAHPTAAPKPSAGSSSCTAASRAAYRNRESYRLRMLLIAGGLRL